MKDEHFQAVVVPDKFLAKHQPERCIQLGVKSNENAHWGWLTPMSREELADVAKAIVDFLGR